VWQFEARGEIRDGALVDSKTLYLLERVVDGGARDGHSYESIVLVDALTGLASSRVPLPVSTVITSSGCGQARRREQPSDLGPLMALDDQVLALLLETHDSHLATCRNGARVTGSGVVESSRTLSVIRVSPTGIEKVLTLWSWSNSWTDAGPPTRPLEDAIPGQVYITMDGHLVAFWLRTVSSGNQLTKELDLTRIKGSERVNVFRNAAPEGHDRPLRMLLDAFDIPQAYISNGSSLEAIDLGQGEALWKMDVSGVPYSAYGYTGDGGVMLIDPGKELMQVSHTGEIIRRTPARLIEPQTIIANNEILHGIDPVSKAFIQIADPVPLPDSGWYVSIDIRPDYTGVLRRLKQLRLAKLND
jgi:hypothetical protein